MMIDNISQLPNYSYKNDSQTSKKFQKAILGIDKPLLNSDSIYDIFNYGYILGDHTLIKDLNRFSNIDVDKLLTLTEKKMKTSITNPADHVLKLLLDEAKGYIGNSKHIGILLSGGLDSRILAGILKKLQEEMHFEVTVLTWGMKNSRDVVYSSMIAEKFGWKLKIYYQDANTLYNNIFNNFKIGCETNPLNLHAMNEVRNEDVELILAASYGDAMGRAEYSGSNAIKMKTISEKSIDKYGFFLKDFSRKRISEIENWDKVFYENYRDYKVDINVFKEITYLRNHHVKYLQVSMSLIDQNIPLKQIFTGYEIVSYIFSLDYNYRFEHLYKDLLKLLPDDIGKIPWARTGKPFGSLEEYQPDTYSPNHHEYASWLYENRNEILRLVSVDMLEEIGIFNMSVIRKSIDIVRKRKHEKLDRLDRNIIFLSSLCEFIRKYNINIEKNNHTNKIDDYFNSSVFLLKQKYVEFKSK